MHGNTAPVTENAYVANLAKMGLAECEDPNANNISRFNDDMTSWPPVAIEYGVISFSARSGHALAATTVTVEKLGSL